MSRYLSPEWLAELDAVVRNAAVEPRSTVTVEQRVTGAAGGDVVYHLTADEGGARVTPGAAPGRADVVFTQDLGTACAVARGELSALDALQGGRIRLDGDAGLLRSAAALFAAVAGAAGSMRDSTDYRIG